MCHSSQPRWRTCRRPDLSLLADGLRDRRPLVQIGRRVIIDPIAEIPCGTVSSDFGTARAGRDLDGVAERSGRKLWTAQKVCRRPRSGWDTTSSQSRLSVRCDSYTVPMDRRTFLGTGAGLLTATMLGVAACAADREGASLADLGRRLNGSLLLPDSPRYLEEARSTNTRFDSVLPIAVALCQDPDDVRAAVNWCRESGVSPTIRGGGHSFDGCSNGTGLLIKTAIRGRPVVDWNSGTVRVNAGALNRTVMDELRSTQHAIPLGSCLDVGVIGLALGGGFGFNSRWGGVTSDRLVSTEIVTADGELRTASSTSNPELYWALRGGSGGNFGVNTSMTFELFPVPHPTVSLVAAEFIGSDNIARCWSEFDRLAQRAPDTYGSFLAILRDSETGRPYLRFEVSNVAPMDETRDLVDPIINAGNPTGTNYTTLPFWQAQYEWLAIPAMPRHAYGDASRLKFDAFTPETVLEMVHRIEQSPQRTETQGAEFRSLMFLGGSVISSVPASATAFVHRNVIGSVQAGVWYPPHAAEESDFEQWKRDQWEFVTSNCPPQTFQNFPWEGVHDWPTAYYGSNWDRLVQVKRKYDPNNLFRFSQSIPP